MPKYIDAEQVDRIIGNAYEECMIASLQPENQTQKHVATGLNYALNLIHDKVPAVNVDEVQHGKWHIIDDPYSDDSEDAPTERGYYRIIDIDGNEFTDFYYGEPTLIGQSIKYWRGGMLPIKAWRRCLI